MATTSLRRDIGTRRLFALVAGPLFAIYLLTGTYTPHYGNDRLTNVLTAANLADDHTPFLDQYEALVRSDLAAIVAARDDHLAAVTPPGAALWAVPFYWIDQTEPEIITLVSDETGPATFDHPSLVPATVAAALAVALAMGFLCLTIRRVAPAGVAIAGAYVMGLATTAWTVAAESLWTHGPAMLWLSIGVYAAASNRWATGAAYGLAIITRPVTAFIAAADGLFAAVRERSPMAAIRVAVGAGAGLAALIAYNAAVFGQASVQGGYGPLGSRLGYAANLFLFFFSPTRGLLVYAPFLVVLAFGIPAAWRVAPTWAKGAFVGGIAYFALHNALNIFSGGFGFPAYRYPLEGLVVAAPLLALAFTEWVAERPTAAKWFGYLVAVAAVAHTVWAIGFGLRF